MREDYFRIANQISKYGIEMVAQSNNYSINELLAILDIVSLAKKTLRKDKKNYQKLILKKRFLLHLQELKIAVLSDTHIGHKNANMEYIKRAYDYFDTLGIHTIFHGGDLLDGVALNNIDATVAQEICMEQLYYFSSHYPKGFHNFIVLGNHEEKFSRLKIDLIQEIPNFHEDFIVLGFGRAYFINQSYRIVLSHSVSNKILLPPLFNDCDLYLTGHSHLYSYDSKCQNIKIPTCSDIHPNMNLLENGKEGFLILKFEETQILSTRYVFSDQQIKKKNVERIRKK